MSEPMTNLKLDRTQQKWESTLNCRTCSSPCDTRGFIPSNKKIPKSKYLTAKVSPHYWSYIENNNGNCMRITLLEYGSCTPQYILQRYIDELPVKEQKKLAKECDEKKDVIEEA